MLAPDQFFLLYLFMADGIINFDVFFVNRLTSLISHPADKRDDLLRKLIKNNFGFFNMSCSGMQQRSAYYSGSAR